MSETTKMGTIGWIDLTVPNADEILKFYKEVAGWTDSPINMGKYDDYCVFGEDKKSPVAGICNKKGTNAKIPSQWMIYINVENIEISIQKCIENGGQQITPLKSMGEHGKYSHIQDPAGAVFALYEPNT